jgi:hypothetical protein
MDISKIKKINELKNDFKIFVYFENKMNVKWTREQEEELEKKFAESLNFFQIKKNKIIFFNLKIEIKKDLIIINNDYKTEKVYINSLNSLKIKKINNKLIIENLEIKYEIDNIINSKYDIEIDGKDYETIGEGTYIHLSPNEFFLYDLLYRILDSIIEYKILRKQYYVL